LRKLEQEVAFSGLVLNKFYMLYLKQISTINNTSNIAYIEGDLPGGIIQLKVKNKCSLHLIT